MSTPAMNRKNANPVMMPLSIAPRLPPQAMTLQGGGWKQVPNGLRPAGLETWRQTAGRREEFRGASPTRDGRMRPSLHEHRDSLVLAGPLRSQVTGLADFIEVQACGRELGDGVAGSGFYFHVEDLGSDGATNCAFIHGQEVSANPVPALVVVDAIDAHHDFHLGLAPEAGIVGAAELGSRIEVGVLILAFGTDELDSGLVVGVFLEIVVGEQFEPDLLGAGHLVFRLELHPFAAGADSVLFILVGAHGALLGKGGCSTKQRYARQHGQGGAASLMRCMQSVHCILQTNIPIYIEHEKALKSCMKR